MEYSSEVWRQHLFEQLIETIILGAIQGFTEWLPISSTGHLKLAEQFMQFSSPQNSLAFEFALHIGTLIVAIIFFRVEIREILSSSLRLDFKSNKGRLVPLIIAGTVPAMILGLLLHEAGKEQISQSFKYIAAAFTICGIIIYFSKLGKERDEQIDFLKAIIVGVAEGIAVIPGFSRSGLTIAAALLLGLRRDEAFKFSALLSIPAVIGAAGYTLYVDFDALTSADLGLTQILVGVLVAVAAGYASLKLLWTTLSTRKFHLFGFYCCFVGVSLLALH